MSLRFVHSADVHLDSPLRGLSRYDGAPVDVLRGASRKAFEHLIQFTLEQEASFLVIAGDLYDGALQDFSASLFVARHLSRLHEPGVKTFIIQGNHDATNRMRKDLRSALPSSVRIFSATQPESAVLEDLGVAIHGQSYAIEAVRENLVQQYPAAMPGLLNIGMLHTSLTGREGHANYAPCTQQDLERLGYDYWALGHVHQREAVSHEPPIHFSGNVQGRHIRETGPKGALLVEMDRSGNARTTFQALDAVRWERLIIDAAGMSHGHELLDAFDEHASRALAESGGRLLAARVVITGETKLHAALIARREMQRAELTAKAESLPGDLWLEKLEVQTRPIRAKGPHDRSGATGELMHLLNEAAQDRALLEPHMSQLAPFFEKVRGALPEEASALDFADGSLAAKRLEEVRGYIDDALSELATRPSDTEG